MSRYDIDTFIERRDGDRSPIHDWKWHCTSLPYGFDTDYVEQVNLPFPSFSVKPLFGAGTFSYYPGFMEISAFNMEFHEDITLRTTTWLTQWRERIRDPKNGAYYLPKNYKEDLNFELLDDKNNTILKVVAKNCFPTQANDWNLNYTSTNGLLKVGVNFSTDRIEHFK